MEILLVASPGEQPLERLLGTLGDSQTSVRVLHRLRVAEQAIRASRLDAVVLDARLADEELVAGLRREHPAQVLVAWLPASSSSRAAALLEAGADEVLDPTMGERELRARLTNALRRGRRAPAAPLELGALRLDPAHGEASWRGSELPLTRRERQVLQALAEWAGRTVRREVLYRRVWGYTMARGDRAVDVNVKRLRDKLTAAGLAVEIKTQAGVGYRLEVAAAAPEPRVPGPIEEER